MNRSKPFGFNFPKLRQLAKDIREATRRKRRFNWDEFDMNPFFADCERPRQIFEEAERRQKCAEECACDTLCPCKHG